MCFYGKSKEIASFRYKDEGTKYEKFLTVHFYVEIYEICL